MRILPDPLSFEWDKGNIDKNLTKHGVSNREAEEAFKNKPVFLFEDLKHSQKEKRYGLFGQTDKGRLLSIVFTIRNNKVRIISTRDISKNERMVYEELKKNTKI